MRSTPIRTPNVGTGPRAKELPQYSLRQIPAVWVTVTITMSVLGWLVTPLLSRFRYRSTWMCIVLHSAQSVYFALLVLGVVLGLA